MTNKQKLSILFVLDRIGFEEIISIPILSAVVKDSGHFTKLIVDIDKDNSLTEFESFEPDIVAYSITSVDADKYVALNKRLKKRFNFFSLFWRCTSDFLPRTNT